ncbi:MAG: hypothetical protein H6744_15305 [Deltaproteobacteria bacterium]|nr:hypothetical protein [Deltaproteobacteria bacterium]MCB9788049.1 hypothetical protein [Deltaproteobacteria bacterium]
MHHPKSPKQLVADSFGSRAALVDAIIGVLGDEEGLRSRLMGTTNKKLLRIHEVAQTVQKRFGGKSGLLDAAAKLQFPKGGPNPGWREKMEGYTVKRLLDHHDALARRASKARD